LTYLSNAGDRDHIGNVHCHVDRCLDDQHVAIVTDARQAQQHDDGQRTPSLGRGGMHQLVHPRVPAAALGIAEQIGEVPAICFAVILI